MSIEPYKKVNFKQFAQLNTELEHLNPIPSTTHQNKIIDKCALIETISLHSITQVLGNKDVSDLCSFYNISVTDLADNIYDEINTGMYSVYDLYDIAGQISYCSIPEEGRIIKGAKNRENEIIDHMQPFIGLYA